MTTPTPPGPTPPCPSPLDPLTSSLAALQISGTPHAPPGDTRAEASPATAPVSPEPCGTPEAPRAPEAPATPEDPVASTDVHLATPPQNPAPPAPHPLAGVAQGIREGRYKKIGVLCGAGISVSCGIPDFRTKHTGLYDNLQKYNLPTPEAIFELSYFRKRPEAFFQLAKELYPDLYTPSPTHFFLRLLQDKHLLHHCFTQNIDGLERKAGLTSNRHTQAHGGFGELDECIECRQKVPASQNRVLIERGEVPRCPKCQGLVKPMITFFGEDLPALYDARVPLLKDADLLLILGTSLVVKPFAYLIHEVGSTVPRVLLNREPVGTLDPQKLGQLHFERQKKLEELEMRGAGKKDKELTRLDEAIAMEEDRLEFSGVKKIDPTTGEPVEPRDIFYSCNLDTGVRELCRLIGGDWEQRLDELIQGGG